MDRALPQREPVAQASVRPVAFIAWVVLAIVLCAAGGTLYAFRGKVFGPKKSPSSPMNTAGDSAEGEGSTGEEKSVSVQVATNNVAWRPDLADAKTPDADVAGKLRGEFVACNRQTLTGGALGFRQTTRGTPDLSVTIYFFAKQAEELRGKIISLTTNDSPVPRVIVRWKEGRDTRSQVFTNGYALKMEFGEIIGNHMPGKIYLCLPDEAQSRVAGIFNAEIKKPSPPKPHPQKPKPPG